MKKKLPPETVRTGDTPIILGDLIHNHYHNETISNVDLPIVDNPSIFLPPFNFVRGRNFLILYSLGVVHSIGGGLNIHKRKQ